MIIILHCRVVPSQLTNHINQDHSVITGRSVLITIVIVLSYLFFLFFFESVLTMLDAML